MKSNYLYIMIGIPGCGKTTLAKRLSNIDRVVVSRDDVRFSLIDVDKDEYFSKEDEVFNTFVQEIVKNLKAGKDVIADATHLTVKSRTRLLQCIPKTAYQHLAAIYFDVTLPEAISQNEARKGTVAYVPQTAIKNMYHSLQEPMPQEGFDKIYTFKNGELYNTIL